MLNQESKTKVIHHAIAIAIMLVVAIVYCLPQIQGEKLPQHDIVQSKAMAWEINEMRDQYGHEPLWTGSMFGGMPSFFVSTKYPSNLSTPFLKIVPLGFKGPIRVIFLLFLGFYVLAVCAGVKQALGVVGAIGFGLSTFFLFSIDAGHMAKITAISFMAPVIGGVILAYHKEKILLGAALVTFAFALNVTSKHVQITYYLGFCVAFLVIGFLVLAIIDGKLPSFIKASIAILAAFIIGIGPSYSFLYSSNVHSKETIRGGNTELVKPETQGQTETGLKWDYATRWSYGPEEVVTFFIPNAVGGGLSYNYEGMELYDRIYPSQLQYFLQQGQGPEEAAENARKAAGSIYYWGPQSFVNGPVYFGIVMLFLFILGMIIAPQKYKWPLLAVLLFTILLSFGKHFEGFFRPIWENLPLYSKFRTPSMIMLVPSLVIPFVAILGLNELLKGTWGKKELLKAVYISAGIVGGIVLLFGFLKGYEYSTAQEAQNFGETLGDERAEMLRSDAVRSLILLLIGAGVVWLYANKTIKEKILIYGIGAIVVIDIWGVGMRMLNHDKFVPATDYDSQFEPRQVDLQIQQQDPTHFRVYDVTSENVFSDAFPSIHHNSVAGYNAAKLYRYQDMIEHHIGRGNQRVLDMLNTKYYIVEGQGGVPQAQINQNALGNAWYVEQLILVGNANQEIDTMNTFRPAKQIVVDKRFEDKLSGFMNSKDSTGHYSLPYDANATIELTEYVPFHITYSTNASQDMVAVFSENYYLIDGEGGWQAYIDGQPVDHFRANYILRGMVIPAGEHVVEFKFELDYYHNSERISLIFSILFLIVGVGGLGFEGYKWFKSSSKEAKAKAA